MPRPKPPGFEERSLETVIAHAHTRREFWANRYVDAPTQRLQRAILRYVAVNLEMEACAIELKDALKDAGMGDPTNGSS